MCMYMVVCGRITDEGSAWKMGFAFCFCNKMVSIFGGEVSFRMWLYDLWKLVFACWSLLSANLWWDTVVTGCRGAGVGLFRISAVGSLSVG